MSCPQVPNTKFDSFNTAISRLVGVAHKVGSVDAETERARAAEAALAARLDALVIPVSETSVAAESDRARAAETALSARLDALSRTAGEAAVTAESQRARSVETALTARLDSLVRAAPVWTVSVEAETDRAKRAEADLATRLDSLAPAASDMARAQAAEADLAARLQIETTRAQRAEADIAARVDAVSTSPQFITFTSNATLGRECYVVANATSGSVALTLPLAQRYPGRVYNVFRADTSANAVTIKTGGDALQAAAGAISLAPGTFSQVMSAGDLGWYAVAGAGTR